MQQNDKCLFVVRYLWMHLATLAAFDMFALQQLQLVAATNANLRSTKPSHHLNRHKVTQVLQYCLAKECTQSHGCCKGSDCSRLSLHPNIYVTWNGEALVEVGVGGTEWARPLTSFN